MHGFSQCSECGHNYDGQGRLTFNDHCAKIVGYRPTWRYQSHFWIRGDDSFILKAQYDPYHNMTQLAEVIDVILADEQDTKRLTKYIVDTSVKDAFRKFATEYNPEKDYE